MSTQYYCKNALRRNAVRDLIAGNDESITLNGMDYLEVSNTDQRILKVTFLNPPHDSPNPVPPAPIAALTVNNVIIEGGVRIRNVQVVSVSAAENTLTVTVNQSGDFSTYNLRLVVSPTQLMPPAGFDPQLATIPFCFKVTCPNEFDCKTDVACQPETHAEPEISYLAKDYASFRQLMLDRISVIMPDWKERNPADLQVAVIELLAYVGDHLSYFQDAVGTEAYLGTARRRVSVRRHARLLDYFVHDGCNARVFVCFDVEAEGGADGLTLARGTPLLTGRQGSSVTVSLDELDNEINAGALVFETMHDVVLRSAHNRILFYTWSDSHCCLPKQATRATFVNQPALSLKEGDVLVFEENFRQTTSQGQEVETDREHRHAVRLTNVSQSVDPLNNTPILEIEWNAEDALPFPLCISTEIIRLGVPVMETISVARGNVVLADHGRTFRGESLAPEIVTSGNRYRPRLQRSGISFAVPYVHGGPDSESASSTLQQDVHQALPVVSLKLNDETWTVRKDLLSSYRFALDFVVETESDGSSVLRFGDNVLGKKPEDGSEFKATYRIGNGRAGMVGAEALNRIVVNGSGITRVWNPLAASGGHEPESLEQVRQFAPQAFRVQERAVTETDWVEVAQRQKDVEKAAAQFRWTGSWFTAAVTLDRIGGRAVVADTTFSNRMRSALERYRVAGYDLEINDPLFVPLDILMKVCVKPGYFRSNIKQILRNVFGTSDLPNGQRGFFHPDNLSFGQSVYLSQLYEQAMRVGGVASVDIVRFQRWGKAANNELDNGFIPAASSEILRLDNDPNFPENGRIEFDIQGGI